MKTHNDMTAGWKKDSTFRKEYDALEEQFALFDVLLKARYDAGLTQAEVAGRIGQRHPELPAWKEVVDARTIPHRSRRCGSMPQQ